MDDPTRKGLVREANEMRSVARRLLRMRADQTDVTDRDRLAAYAAHLEEYALELEGGASFASDRVPARPAALNLTDARLPRACVRLPHDNDECD